MKVYKLVDVFTPEGFYLTQGYGVNPATYSKYGLLWHEGVDLGDRNDPKPKVRAAHDGIVIQDWDTTKGNYGEHIVVWDDVQNCATWYCHLDENYVEYGQRVKAGDVIGVMGSTGNVTGKHLHFNFVQTDSSGTRSHNTKAKNLGFLDPQLPFDPNPPKFPPGVANYKVEWEPVSSTTGDMTKELQACLDDRKKFWEERDAIALKLSEEHIAHDETIRELALVKKSFSEFQDKRQSELESIAVLLNVKPEMSAILPAIETCITYEDKANKANKALIEAKQEYEANLAKMGKTLEDLEKQLVAAKREIERLKEQKPETGTTPPTKSIWDLIVEFFTRKQV